MLSTSPPVVRCALPSCRRLVRRFRAHSIAGDPVLPFCPDCCPGGCDLPFEHSGEADCRV